MKAYIVKEAGDASMIARGSSPLQKGMDGPKMKGASNPINH